MIRQKARHFAMTEALILSAVISFANLAVAVAVFKKAFQKKEFGEFSKMVFTSMTIRLVIMTLFAWTFIFFLEIDKFYFAIGLITMVFISIMIEILIFHSYTKKKKETK